VNDITICIGTVGYPTFHKCYESCEKIKLKNRDVKEIIVIEDEYPLSAWLNRMSEVSSTKWILQVDEDMYLNARCIEIFKLLMNKNRGRRVANISGLLFDRFLKINIGSLKMWSAEVLNQYEFKDVLFSDRTMAEEVTKDGYILDDTPRVLGEHDSAPTPEIAYFKYKNYVQKARELNGVGASRYLMTLLKKRHQDENSLISFCALKGGEAGLYSDIDNVSKNYLNIVNSDEFNRVIDMYDVYRSNG
jgi:hypothetical protein